MRLNTSIDNSNVKEYREELTKQKIDIVKEANGKRDSILKSHALANIKTDTTEYKNWITNIQQNFNPLIGKHVAHAPEYEVDQIELDNELIKMGIELRNKLENDIRNYSTIEYDADDESELASDLVDNEKKFIDIIITENITKKYSDRTDEDIKDFSLKIMRTYHDDSSYQPEIDMKPVIEHSRLILLSNNEEKMSLLTNMRKF